MKIEFSKKVILWYDCFVHEIEGPIGNFWRERTRIPEQSIKYRVKGAGFF